MKAATVLVVGAAACAVAVVVIRHRMKITNRCTSAMGILRDFKDKSDTPISKLRQVADAMTVEMHAGLASEGASKLKMIISYVNNLPTGYVISSSVLIIVEVSIRSDRIRSRHEKRGTFWIKIPN